MGHFFLLVLISSQLMMLVVEAREMMTLHGAPRGSFGIFPKFGNPFDDLTMSLSETQPVYARASPNHPIPDHFHRPPNVHNFRKPRNQMNTHVTQVPLLQIAPSASNVHPVYRENRLQNINSGSSSKMLNLNPNQSPGAQQNKNRQAWNNVMPQPQHISLASIRVEDKHELAQNYEKQFLKSQNNHVKQNLQIQPRPTPPHQPNSNNNYVFVSPIKPPLFGQPAEFGSPEPDQYGQAKNSNHLFAAEHYHMKDNAANGFQPIHREPIRVNLNNGRELQIVNDLSNFHQVSRVPMNNNRHTHHPGAKNENEALNVFKHGRSMQEIKPQLPARPSFNNGGIQINAIREQLPILHLDNGNIANNRQIPNQNEHYPMDNVPEQKKTFLVFKAPALVTTERPPSAPFSVNTVDNVQSNIRSPEFDYPPTTQPPPTIMTHSIEAPAIVFDLLQIPVDNVFEDLKNHNVGSAAKDDQTIVNSEFKPLNFAGQHQNYPTTPMYETDDHKKPSETYEHKEYYHKPSPEKVYQSFHNAANISSLPVSYSSSISVIAENPSTKPKTTKSKMTLKKSLPAKKRAKSSVTRDSEGDDSYGHQNVPGRPGADYPTYNEIPFTNFDCRDTKTPGFYADLEAGCQVFHNCDMEMKKHSFMCPNGTIFHQELFICDWWYNVNCDDASEFYNLNEGLYIEDEKNPKSKKKQ